MKIRKMSFEKRIIYYLLKIIGVILSIVPLVFVIICMGLDLLLSFLHNMASWMVISFMHPSKKYLYKHECGKDVYLDRNGKARVK